MSGEDPMKYLAVSHEQKMKDAAMPFDAKKLCWVPTSKDEEEGYVMGEIESSEGENNTVNVKGSVSANNKLIPLQFRFILR